MNFSEKDKKEEIARLYAILEIINSTIGIVNAGIASLQKDLKTEADLTTKMARQLDKLIGNQDWRFEEEEYNGN